MKKIIDMFKTLLDDKKVGTNDWYEAFGMLGVLIEIAIVIISIRIGDGSFASLASFFVFAIFTVSIPVAFAYRKVSDFIDNKKKKEANRIARRERYYKL